MEFILTILVIFFIAALFLGVIFSMAELLVSIIGWLLIAGLILGGVFAVGSGVMLGWVPIIIGAACLFGGGG